MKGLHVYAERFQPATCWVDTHFDPPMVFSGPANRLVWCRCCHKQCKAKNCVVQSYYDGATYWCAESKGCKDPKAIAKKQRGEFRRRSMGQRARWTRKKEATR